MKNANINTEQGIKHLQGFAELKLTNSNLSVSKEKFCRLCVNTSGVGFCEFTSERCPVCGGEGVLL